MIAPVRRDCTWPLAGYLIFPCGCTHYQQWDDEGNVLVLQQPRCDECRGQSQFSDVTLRRQYELPLQDRDIECELDHRQDSGSGAMLR